MFNETPLTDLEKLLFTEDYIVLLKAALAEKENNDVIYRKNLEEIHSTFIEASKGYRKLNSYKREMQAHRQKVIVAERKAEKFEGKNYALRQKVRALEGELAMYHESHKGNE